MNINFSYDQEFINDWNKLKRLKNAQEFFELDGIGSQLDINKFSKEFFKQKQATADVSIDANSNLDNVNIVNYRHELAKPIERLNSYYRLWKVGRKLFNEEIVYDILKKQITKLIYINDFHSFGTGQPYCANFTALDIMMLGLPFVKRVTSSTPKHFDTFLNQLVEFLAFAGNNFAGATAVADVWIVASYYYDKWYRETEGKMSKEYQDRHIRQNVQAFIFRVNQLYRDSIQTIFTNVSVFDDGFLNKWIAEYTFIDGSKPNKESIKVLQDIYLDEMNKILETSPATFPITTACFSLDDKGKIIDEEFLDYISEKNLKYGFINIFAGKTSVLSSCCRLSSDSNNEFFNTFGAGGMKIGSTSIATINIPRLASLSSCKQDFFDRLEENVLVVQRVNHIRRSIVQDRIDKHHAPIYNYGFMTLKKQYSTCGLIGVYEAVEILGMDILTEEGQDFVIELLDVVNSKNKDISKKYNVPTNCEQIPGENVSVKLAQIDRMCKYTDYSLYSNQFIPLIHSTDILNRIKLQGKFDKFMTGGAIMHLNIADKITNKSYMKKLIKFSIENGVVYHAINYNLQKCEGGCITVGKSDKCQKCGKNILENYVRVVGFLTPISNWNKVRREIDYPNRQFYKKKANVK